MDTSLNSTRVAPTWSKFLHHTNQISPHIGSWIELSATAFNHNMRCYADNIGSTRIAVVVKSNGYGHGLEQMALLCDANQHVAWLCTSTLSEALRIRALGVTKPVLVLSYIDGDPELASIHNIDLAVHDFDAAQRLSAAVTGSIQVHIKIDTGLSRFGYPTQGAVAAVLRTAQLPRLVIRGLYTHFAVSGGVNHAHIEQQYALFQECTAELARAGFKAPLVHTAKSVVAARVPGTRCDMVRLGAGAYGLCAQEIDLPLAQMLTWKARIMHIRTVQCGAYIGYNRTYQAQRDMKIAVLPIGYYEGYPLSLSNQGRVFIPRFQRYAPVVGRVCMNQIMIDVSDMSDIVLGDEVELIGDRDGIRIFDVAKDCASNNEREFVARLNPLLPRIIEN